MTSAEANRDHHRPICQDKHIVEGEFLLFFFFFFLGKGRASSLSVAYPREG